MAQVTTSTVLWGVNLPHVDVVVINSTTDRAPVQAAIDNKSVRGVLDGGEQHAWRFDQTAWGYAGPMNVQVEIEVCRTTTNSPPLVAPPEWAMDRVFLGDLAITQKFLSSPPSETVLRQRVEDIKKLLDGRGELGRGRMKKELERWFKFCLKVGSRSMGPSCGDVAQRFVFPLDVTEYFGQRVYILEVRGDGGNYSLYHPPDHY